MVWGGMAWRRSFALVALPALASTLFSACVAPDDRAAIPTDSPEMTALPLRGAGMISGREYVLGQVVAREHDRNDKLQHQLDQRSQELQRLHAEVEELRQHEAELRTALEHVQATAGSAAPSAPAAVSAASRPRAGESEAADSNQAEAAARATAALAQQQQQQREAEQEHQAAIARLQTALTQEQQRREQAETQLAKLKEETSTPPYGPSETTEAELAAAKQQVTELRAALDDERAARERLAQDFGALQRRTASGSASAENTGAENADLRLRLQQLQEEKRNLTESFNRSLAESQRHAADLERELSEAHAAPAPAVNDGDGQTANVRAENSALRSRLDEEHRRTEELTAKLKVATRVTDLIFKMQAQQAPRY